jgi:hypothetical protein
VERGRSRLAMERRQISKIIDLDTQRMESPHNLRSHSNRRLGDFITENAVVVAMDNPWMTTTRKKTKKMMPKKIMHAKEDDDNGKQLNIETFI